MSGTPPERPAVGVDVASIARIARALERHPTFARRCFTAAEARVSRGRPERFAGRWAVKEAVRKVCGARGWPIPPYAAIEVRRAPGQAPRAFIGGSSVPGLAVSLTHDAGVAIAVALHQGGHRAPAGLSPPGGPAPLSLPERSPTGHKGTFGTVAVIAGHARYPGAPVLCTLGALRGGAGKVRAVVPAAPGAAAPFPPEVILQTIVPGRSGGFAPPAMRTACEAVDGSQAVAVGPGLGQAAETAAFLAGLLAHLGGAGGATGARQPPLVLDADGLNLCAADPRLLAAIPRGSVLTPHPAEMARLLGRPTAAVQGARTAVASELATRLESVVVLKGAGTVIAGPGGQVSVDPHATSVLATGGSGDVLTGLISALLAQGAAPLDAARAGVFIHGEAGRLLEEERGRAGLLASEIADRCVEAQELVRRTLEDSART